MVIFYCLNIVFLIKDVKIFLSFIFLLEGETLRELPKEKEFDLLNRGEILHRY